MLTQYGFMPDEDHLTLGFWLHNRTSSGNGDDVFKCLVDDTPVFQVLEGAAPYTEGYTLVTVDVSSFADGLAHLLKFDGAITGMDASGTGPAGTVWLVDDVSLRVPGTAIDPPVAPSGLTATPCTRSLCVHLEWTDNSAEEDGFVLERRSGVKAEFEPIKYLYRDTEEVYDSEVYGLSSYTYRIKAFNAGGDSAYSEEASASTGFPPTNPLIAPSGLTAEPSSSTSAFLTWQDNSSDEDGFKVERVAEGPDSFAEIADVPADTTNYADDGLTTGVTYYYRVYAYRGGTFSLLSNTASVTPEAVSAPVLTGPSEAVDTYVLTWAYDWQSTSSTDHYELEYSYTGAPGGWLLFGSGADGDRTSPFDQCVYPVLDEIGITTYFRVRAYSNGVYTPYSNVVGVFVPALHVQFYASHDNLIIYSSLDTIDSETGLPYAQSVYDDAVNMTGTGFTYWLDTLYGYITHASAFRFDELETVLAGRTIDSAWLTLTPFGELPIPSITTYSAHAYNAPYDPNTLTWSNQPSMLAAPYGESMLPGAVDTFWVVDVTSIVQQWVGGSLANNGMVLIDHGLTYDPPVFPGFPWIATFFHMHSLESWTEEWQQPMLDLIIR